MYRYLLIDNDNTLMDFHAGERAALEIALKAHGLPFNEEVYQTYHALNLALWKALERGETTQQALKAERFRQLLEKLNVTDVVPADVTATYEGQLRLQHQLMDGAVEFLQAMKDAGMKIALVSNGVSVTQRTRLSLCAFTPLLDAVVISEEIGVFKPDPEMVYIAMKALGATEKSECILVGDSASADVAAGVNAGVDTIHLNADGAYDSKATYGAKSLKEVQEIIMQQNRLETIYLAGGCYWGVQKYISLIPGVKETEVGFACGQKENPTYDEVKHTETGHAETVRVVYDPQQVTLRQLLRLFFRIIDPTILNRQGEDAGTQYRTGIYTVDEASQAIAEAELKLLSEKTGRTLVTECHALTCFYPAHEAHQMYLDKNPGGYCHVPFSQMMWVKTITPAGYEKQYETESAENICTWDHE